METLTMIVGKSECEVPYGDILKWGRNARRMLYMFGFISDVENKNIHERIMMFEDRCVMDLDKPS